MEERIDMKPQKPMKMCQPALQEIAYGSRDLHFKGVRTIQFCNEIRQV